MLAPPQFAFALPVPLHRQACMPKLRAPPASYPLRPPGSGRRERWRQQICLMIACGHWSCARAQSNGYCSSVPSLFPRLSCSSSYAQSSECLAPFPHSVNGPHQIMRAAVEETVSEHRKDLLKGEAAAKGSVAHHGAPSSFLRARGDGAAGSSLHLGRDGAGTLSRAANVRVQQGTDGRTGEAEQQRIRDQGVDTSGEAFLIKDEACFVMARACELFAMDVAKRRSWRAHVNFEHGARM